VSYLLSENAPSIAFKAFTTSWPGGSEYHSWRNEGEAEPRGLHLWSFVEVRVRLLYEFQHCLLGLVCLLESSHTGGLQDVVLRHVRDRLSNVSILNAVGRAL
jgi:hypothetical protein